MPPGALDHEHYDESDIIVLQNSSMFREHFREDADTIFIARQLDYVRANTYNRQLPAINADRLVPDDTSVPEWAENVWQYAYDMVGMAKVISNYADDLPRADVRVTQRLTAVKTLGDSYGYNINELRASRQTGAGLDARKADAARRAMELKIASIKLLGDAQFGLYGLFTHPNLPVLVLSNPGDWQALTGDQILANLNQWVVAYQNQVKGTHTPNFLELAPKAYTAAATKFITGASGLTPITPLQWFRANYPSITVENIWEMQGAAVSGTKDLGLLYERNSDNIAHVYVMPFTQLPPDARNLEIVTDCIARSGGVNIFYPLALLSALTT
jgi:hypothetical protein